MQLILRYVEPKLPKIICEENLSGSEEELSAEERKQRSRLQQIHLQIDELRELNLPTKETEEELWDVQTAITMLCRKVSTVHMHESNYTIWCVASLDLQKVHLRHGI
ncbi:unnamed protein product [Gongylonema pulchrum]|uniref:BMERB domain-containing protein n=1 Tax=Gongylonema pulchrum TaxID=637853 RepID=A0A183CYA0_9BILA|nr:unnamed protein product [Gongylonema pulchrum]